MPMTEGSLRYGQQALCMKMYWGSGCIDPRFLNFCTSWRGVVSFTPRGKEPLVPIAQEAGWALEPACTLWRKKHFQRYRARTLTPPSDVRC
jgi:hypothetical protein